MYIKASKDFIEEVLSKKTFSEEGKEYLESNVNQRYADTLELFFSKFTEDDLKAIYDYAQETTNRSVMMQVKPFLNYKKNKKTKVTSITTFAAILKDFIDDHAINHWVFKRVDESCQILLAYFVSGIKYDPGDRKDEKASVSMILSANTIGHYDQKTVSFYTEDLSASAEEILFKRGFMHETQELIDEYLEDQREFLDVAGKGYVQLQVDGQALMKDSWFIDTIEAVNVKGILDTAHAKRSLKTMVGCKFWTGEDEIYSMPVHPYLHLFSLTHHAFINVHIRNAKIYEYDDSLKEKLVLPPTHRDLLDILVTNLDVLKGDIIEGKSTGTTILCKGRPGTGKTLTAEAYSEISHKPLYKVTSGQLGISAGDVEKKLEEILTRAEKYGAILLIDEADTFIRARGNDIQHNAIVAAFLRTLEYFNGILFLTTNRDQDIDDAIESRCIATIIYETPTVQAAKEIWRILSKEFLNELDASMIEILVKVFPECTGRDIKELLKLSLRYAQGKGHTVCLEDFIACAKFRAIRIEEKVLEAFYQNSHSLSAGQE